MQQEVLDEINKYLTEIQTNSVTQGQIKQMISTYTLLPELSSKDSARLKQLYEDREIIKKLVNIKKKGLTTYLNKTLLLR